MREPKFEVYVDKAGEYRFRLVAANGETIADSEGYKTKQGCLKGIASVQRNASKSKIVFEAQEITAKELVKRLVRKEKEYANAKMPDVVKSVEEVADERKTFKIQPLKRIPLPGKGMTSWM